MEDQARYFSYIDYIVFAIVLLISTSIGIYYRFSGGKQKTFKEYLLADQQMSIIPVAFSLMASFMSAITLLGVSKEHYTFGTQFIVINFSYIFSTPIVCYVFLPVFFRLQKFSVYEYLEMRFGNATRILASLAFSLQITLYMGIVLFAPALALSAVTGISETWSILAVGLVCTFYSTIGGMKAVLITDVFQSLLMFAAVFVVIVRGVLDFGFQGIFHHAAQGERLEFFDFSIDPRVRHTFWNLGIGGMFTYCSLYGVNQAQVQRLLTVKSLKKAQGALWLQWIILMFLSISTSFAGLIMYAEFRSCDPLLAKKISNSDQLLPYYVVKKLGSIPGVSGLFVSGIFSGSLSTVSSALNSLSAVTVHDYIMFIFPSLKKKPETASTLGKIIALFYGILCIGIAFSAKLLGTGVLQVSLTIFGAVGGPLLGLFTLGMAFRGANQKGALMGLITGLILTLWIGFGQPKPPPPIKPLTAEGCLSNTQILIESALSYEQNFTTTMMSTDIMSMNLSSIVSDEEETKKSIENANTEREFNPLHELYAISYMWMATIGFITTLGLGLLTSCCTGGNPNDVDRYLLFSFVWNKADRASEADRIDLNVGAVINQPEIDGKVISHPSETPSKSSAI